MRASYEHGLDQFKVDGESARHFLELLKTGGSGDRDQDAEKIERFLDEFDTYRDPEQFDCDIDTLENIALNTALQAKILVARQHSTKSFRRILRYQLSNTEKREISVAELETALEKFHEIQIELEKAIQDRHKEMIGTKDRVLEQYEVRELNIMRKRANKQFINYLEQLIAPQ